MELVEIVMKLIGNVTVIGDEAVDELRSQNMQKLVDLQSSIMDIILQEAYNVNGSTLASMMHQSEIVRGSIEENVNMLLDVIIEDFPMHVRAIKDSGPQIRVGDRWRAEVDIYTDDYIIFKNEWFLIREIDEIGGVITRVHVINDNQKTSLKEGLILRTCVKVEEK